MTPHNRRHRRHRRHHRIVLTALALAAVSCSPGAGHPGRAAGTTTVPPAKPSAGLPRTDASTVRREALGWAARNHAEPGPGGFVPVGSDPDWDPELVWQSAESGDLCLAEGDGLGVSFLCEKAADITAMPSPGLKGVFDATLDVTARRFRVLILSTGEDLVSLGCTDETVQPQKVVEVGVGGSRYVLSWAAIGADRGGTYRAAVHRNGAAASESIVLHAMGEVSC